MIDRFDTYDSSRNKIMYENDTSLPGFEEKELKLGYILAHGSFCSVTEIKDIRHLSKFCFVDYRKRLFIINFLNNDNKSYVMKRLHKNEDYNKEKLSRGIRAIAVEAKILSSLNHPHIIKIAATSSNDYFNENSFLIMERLLDETLEQRFDIWLEKEMNLNKKMFIRKMFDLNKKGKKKKKDLTLQKLFVAYYLSSAMDYIHRRRIMHRDLKPENIGFDVNGKVILYDFGLATQLDIRDKLEDGNYKLTGGTGTMRYMAPEIVKYNPYNLSADVFSFGVLLWQIMSCIIPYETFSVGMYKKLVVYNGFRLPLDRSWPSSYSNLISRCWSASSSERPKFREIKEVLRLNIENLGGAIREEEEEKVITTSNRNICDATTDHGYPPSLIAGVA